MIVNARFKLTVRELAKLNAGAAVVKIRGTNVMGEKLGTKIYPPKPTSGGAK